MNLSEETLKRLRCQMVKEQLAGRDIRDKRILDAFKSVPRHRFVGPLDQQNAYSDFPLPIGSGQTISQPYIVALMTQLADLKKTSKVLEIGTGSGYQTAVLAELVKEVFSIERIGSLAERAKKILMELGYGNICIEVGDGTLGWREFAQFDKIIVTASSPEIPSPLIDQLALGGNMVIPIGPRFSQRLVVIEKSKKGRITRIDKSGCVFVSLIGEYGWQDEKEKEVG
ncbi:MAG: protein-L-isoaspartate(D-aspartate) O-methyltransferase [Candidatus Omnitrophota bacterium]